MRVALGLFATACWFFFAVAYLFSATVADHAEASVAALSLIWHNGQPLYDSAQPLRTPLYGPVLFAANRIHLLFSSDILSTGKLLGIVASSFALIGILVVSRRRVGLADSILVTGFAAAALMAFGAYPISVRGDGLLFLFVSLSIVLMDSNRTDSRAMGLRWFLLGVLAGLAMGVKVTAPIYFLPAAAAAIGTGFRLRYLIYAGWGALLFLTAPFVVFDGLDPEVYLAALKQAADHPRLISKALGVLAWGVILVLPLMATLLIQPDREEWWARFKWPGVALGTTLMLLCVVGSKIGAGGHHAMPLIPVTSWLWAGALGVRRAEAAPSRPRILLPVISLMFFALLMFSIPKVHGQTQTLDAETIREARQELRTILAEEYPHSISLGYGGDYKLSYLRSLVIAEGHDHTLDSSVLMDADLQGLAVGSDVLDSFRSCEVDRWIIPRDAVPFERTSFYGEYGSPNIFGPHLGRVFLESYEPISRHSIFSVWGCRP